MGTYQLDPALTRGQIVILDVERVEDVRGPSGEVVAHSLYDRHELHVAYLSANHWQSARTIRDLP